MEQTEKHIRPNAMAFYNPDGFVPAFKQAAAFAGKEGRIATLPEVIEARLGANMDETPWTAYFTTMSAEYVGLSRAGNPIAIVAHGVGPMDALDGVLKTYSHHFKDKTGTRRGGRISQEEFLKLESGRYGEVAVIDLAATWNRRPFQFSNHAITIKEIAEEPLWQARLGAKWREYAEYHGALARKWHLKQAEQQQGWRQETHLRLAETDSKPSILAMNASNGCCYHEFALFQREIQRTPELAVAHLLSTSGLMQSGHEYHEYDYKRSERRESIASDVSCHDWSDGTRLLGIRSKEPIIKVHAGLSSYDILVNRHLDQLLRANLDGTPETTNGFWHLIEVGGRQFTDYPKQSSNLDRHEPNFLVTKVEQIGEPVTFRKVISGYAGFFNYGIEEVRRLAPHGANAYTFGEIDIESTNGDPSHHVGPVTFYNVTVDTSKRLVRMKEIYHDYDLMMSLID